MNGPAPNYVGLYIPFMFCGTGIRIKQVVCATFHLPYSLHRKEQTPDIELARWQIKNHLYITPCYNMSLTKPEIK